MYCINVVALFLKIMKGAKGVKGAKIAARCMRLYLAQDS